MRYDIDGQQHLDDSDPEERRRTDADPGAENLRFIIAGYAFDVARQLPQQAFQRVFLIVHDAGRGYG